MSWLNYKKHILFLCLAFVSLNSFSGYYGNNIPSYEKRVKNYQNFWYSLIPQYTKIQFVGGMGLMNLGIGWSYGKHEQWETDLMFGFIPKYSSDKTKITMTLKQNYIPWRKELNKIITFEPLECGLYFNTVFSDEFWTKEPDRYPKGYYGFSTRIRTHIFLGQRWKFNIPGNKRFFSKSITAFYEISSCDLYIVSAFTNKLALDDFLRLSFGLKFDIF